MRQESSLTWHFCTRISGFAEPCSLTLQETEEERSLRTRVFVQGAFHWSVSAIGYVILFIIGCAAIPHVFSPVKVRIIIHLRRSLIQMTGVHRLKIRALMEWTRCCSRSRSWF